MRLTRKTTATVLLVFVSGAPSYCLDDENVKNKKVGSLEKRLPLPPDEYDHERNSILNLGPIPASNFSTGSERGFFKLEAKHCESISLRDALLHTLRHNLPIRISSESWKYQKYQLITQLAAFVPSFALGYNITRSHISPSINAQAKVFTAQVSYPVFQGGSVFYNSLAQFYRDRGWQYAYQATLSDALFDTYNKYYDLVLQDALLRIKAKALQLSEYALQLNEAMYAAGVGTQFNVMQSRTQLAFDHRSLLEQEAIRRQSALALSYVLNLPMAIDLVPAETALKETLLLSPSITVNELINYAFNRRPDLRQYEMFRLAAARTVQATAAPLYPQVSFFTNYTHADTTASGMLTVDSAASSSTSSAGVFPGNTKTVQAGFNLTWTLSNMGLLSGANVMSARALSRQAMSQANQALQVAEQQVRTRYISMLTNKGRIDDAARAASAARRTLKFAHMRMRSGLGSNLEIIQAQRDYINALITQSRAIIASNQAQASLLQAAGIISMDTLTDGFQDAKGLPTSDGTN